MPLLAASSMIGLAMFGMLATIKHLMRRLRLFAQVAGRVMLWHTRAVERAYAPGGLGFKEAQADFQAHTSVCM